MSDTPSGMRRLYSTCIDSKGKEYVVTAVTVEPKKCSRCGELIGENCYFVWRAMPGTGACHACRDGATPYEQFQLDRGQAGLVEWLKEQAAKVESAKSIRSASSEEGDDP